MEQRDSLTLPSITTDFADYSVGGLGFNLLSNPVAEINTPPSSFRKVPDEVSSLKEEVHKLKLKISQLENKLTQDQHSIIKHTQLFERLLHQLPCGVIMLDGTGVIEHINEYATRLFNLIKVGDSWLEVIQSEFSPREDDGHEISLRNGRRVTLDTASLDDASGQIVILLDLTETRNLQSQLNHQQRLAEMGKMMASLAHQIRTPLSTAMLYSSHLTGSQLDPLQRVNYAGKLQNRLECINQQICDMLIYVRGGVELDEWVDLNKLLGEVESYCEDFVRPDGSQLTVSYDNRMASIQHHLVRCNRVALIGAFGNLIQNAFQSRETSVLVELSVELGEDQIVTIKVRDNGPGINAMQREKLFTPFYTTKSVGTGLGLPIVKTVVEAHGGDISIESGENKQNEESGCCFTVTLPCSMESASLVDGGLNGE